MLARVGDFYEAYGDDARDLARSVSIVLTSKESGKGRHIAMAGVPHHTLDHYLARLMQQRRVVALAEQMEPPAANRLVRREIVRVLTPGTVLEDQFLAADRNNYLCAVAYAAGRTAIAFSDVSTGSAAVSVVNDSDELSSELDRLAPAEIVVEDEEAISRCRPLVGEACRITLEETQEEQVGRGNVCGPDVVARLPLAAEERPAAKAALRLLQSYLTGLRLDGAGVIQRATVHNAHKAMMLSPATRRHLDLLTGSGENSRASMLNVLTRTKSPMGARMLANWLCAPLVEVCAIQRRQDRVELLLRGTSLRIELQERLHHIGDIERIVQKARARRAGPRDLVALRQSLASAAGLCEILGKANDDTFSAFLTGLSSSGVPADVERLLQAALLEEPPVTMADGGVIRPEYDDELRQMISVRTQSREHLLALEQRARFRSGIKSLKIKYTQAFGYYYEVTRAHAEAIPPDFIRRQTLVGAERFSNAELKQLESDILSARARQVAIERNLFEALLAAVDAASESLLAVAGVVAEIDVYSSLAQVAAERGYVRPQVVQESLIDVSDGRHAVVEAYGGVDFVPNDCRLNDRSRFIFITGPNMGGKSTYLRQTALLCVLAQMGSFVPAARATIGVVDRLFTRIGAGDDIASGRSTFYLEMAEMALILRSCTARSLLLIDEVGRGTGTSDGLSIAQSICEYLLGLENAMPIVLFATHFHELVGLARADSRLENMHVVVADGAWGPVFSHRLLHGASSRSYGIAVAKMAGLPAEVIRRAEEIADELESRPETAAAALRRKTDRPLDASQLDLLT